MVGTLCLLGKGTREDAEESMLSFLRKRKRTVIGGYCRVVTIGTVANGERETFTRQLIFIFLSEGGFDEATDTLFLVLRILPSRRLLQRRQILTERPLRMFRI